MRSRSSGANVLDAHAAFVAGRAAVAEPPIAVYQTSDIWSSSTWETILRPHESTAARHDTLSTQSKYPSRAKRSKYSKMATSIESASRQVHYTINLDSIHRVVSPIVIPERIDPSDAEGTSSSRDLFSRQSVSACLGRPIETSWSASTYRRSIAQICYTWRILNQANGCTHESMRTCFYQPHEESISPLRPWCDVASLVYSMWNNVDEQIRMRPNPRALYDNLFLQVRLGSRSSGSFSTSIASETQLASRLLANIKGYMSEYGSTQETPWYQERIATYKSKQGDALITTRMTKDSIVHHFESLEDSILCQSSNVGFSTGLVMREPVDASQLPSITHTEQVQIVQKKTFVWYDNSYAHTVHSQQPNANAHAQQPSWLMPKWTLHLELSWQAPTMLAVDAAIASRQPPRIGLVIETGPASQNVKSLVPAEMTLYTMSAIYAMIAIGIVPRERDCLTWSIE